MSVKWRISLEDLASQDSQGQDFADRHGVLWMDLKISRREELKIPPSEVRYILPKN